MRPSRSTAGRRRTARRTPRPGRVELHARLSAGRPARPRANRRPVRPARDHRLVRVHDGYDAGADRCPPRSARAGSRGRRTNFGGGARSWRRRAARPPVQQSRWILGCSVTTRHWRSRGRRAGPRCRRDRQLAEVVEQAGGPDPSSSPLGGPPRAPASDASAIMDLPDHACGQRAAISASCASMADRRRQRPRACPG
jgi:hypothetical protein